MCANCLTERVLSAAEAYDLAQIVVQAGGQLQLQVAGRSMHPILPDQTLVTITGLPDRIALGSVVLAKVGQRVIIHRLLWRKHQRYLIAGDACPYFDGWIERSAIVAQAVTWQIAEKSLSMNNGWRWYQWSLAWLRHARRWLIQHLR